MKKNQARKLEVVESSTQKLNIDVLHKLTQRALYLSAQMIHRANHRSDKEKGDPKVGGHQSASASAIHILGALQLVVQSGFDHLAVKPHASPVNHAYNYLLKLLLKDDRSRFSKSEADIAMDGLRAFSKNGEPVFQSYHSHYDPDNHNYLPTGTVGIPPVNLGYLAHAYRFAEEHGYKVPKAAHFWALIGDSEFREGSLYEAMPDFAEREIGSLTWIVDYNRQSLDGHRISNKEIMNGNDDKRLERTAIANGWEVIQVRHGSFRKKVFAEAGGEQLQKFFEEVVKDYELQALLLVQDPKTLKEEMIKLMPELKTILSKMESSKLVTCLRDLGGHDYNELVEAMEKSKRSTRRPTLIIAHTIKGWGLSEAAACGNHSSLIGEEEINDLKKKTGIKGDALYESFSDGSEEGSYLKKRGDLLYEDILIQHQLKEENWSQFQKELQSNSLPDSLDINLKMVNYPHTQWMLGQLTAKLTRIANTPLDSKKLQKGQKELTESERVLKTPSEYLVSMAPDVGTSTNLNPAMDGKIFGAPVVEDVETELHVKDTKLPDLVPGEEISDRFLRFDISESNVMSCLGSYGQLRDLLGVPLLPLMTVYDFFIKRALDQYFYNLYWKSSFILVGTPAGVTLSPEGAQHGWKSDIQIPNQITWEPFYCLELDWILSESLQRHFNGNNAGRNGVLIRCVTRGADQKGMIQLLRKQARYKTQQVPMHPSQYSIEGAQDEASIENISVEEILNQVRQDTLKGGYYLIDYRGYAGYEPGDNVVNIFSMGSPTTEAIKASEELLQKGIYANVIVVTSPDLLVGNLAHADGYSHLKQELSIDDKLYLQPSDAMNGADVITLAGRRVPVVSVHDGEPGLLDNIGSIIGVKQESLAVRKHSKCGRPSDVYAFHGIDSQSVVEAAGKVLSETALEQIQVSSKLLASLHGSESPSRWQELWPTQESESES